jgi:prolyl-tRNA editing enzyme YbaK/EbsC (Cys-tRNA(Pro) deacylase)
MTSDAVKEYSKTLTTMGIDNEIVEHPDLKTPPEVQGYLGLTLADGLSTMLMKAGDKFVVVVRRCDTRLDSKKLKKLVGTSKVRMANPAEFNELTNGLPLGTTRVFMPGLMTYLDERLFKKEQLTSGSGSFTCSVRVRSEDLKNIPNSTVVLISE